MFKGYDTDLERELIGSMLNDYQDYLVGLTDLQPNDFGDDKHKIVFETLSSLAKTSQKTPSVGQVVFALGVDAPSGLFEELFTLKENAIGLDIRYMIGLMMSLRQVRRIISISEKSKIKSINLKRSEYNHFISTFSESSGKLAEDTLETTEYRVQTFATAQTTYSDALERQQLRKEGKSICNGIPTGYIDLDRKLYGLAPGHLVVIGGRPGQGKTSLLLNLVSNMKASKCAIFSLEMTANDLYSKLILMEASVKYENFKNGNLSENDITKIYGVEKVHQKKEVVIDDKSTLSPSQLFIKLSRMKKMYGVDIAFIDYLQLMKGDDRQYENNQVKVASISHSLKSIAKEHNIPIVALAQLNRAVDSQGDRGPKMSDLRESGAIEADADAIILLDRPMKNNVYLRQGVLELTIAKNRYGEIGRVDLLFDPPTGKMQDYSKTTPMEEEQLKKFQDFSPHAR